MTFQIGVVIFFGGLWVGMLIGWFFGRRPLSPDDVERLMNRVVNLEDMEEHEKLVKVRMARNRVKTTRTDGGPNAVVRTMRIHKRPRRF